ncbi:hypothetical protein CFP56_008484, partial [Quercus suber]
GRKKICEGEDVSMALEKEILDLAEKLDNFDKQVILLQRWVEKFGVTLDEICVKEIREMAEASLSIKTSCRVDHSFVSSGKCNVDILRWKMEGLPKGILLNRMEEEYRSMLSSTNRYKCSGRCKAIVQRIVELV